MEIAWIKKKYVYLSKGNKNSCNKHKEVINSQPDEERHDDVCPTYILLNICEIYPRIKEIIIIIIICIPIIVHVSTKLVLKVPLVPLFIRVINHSLIHLSSLRYSSVTPSQNHCVQLQKGIGKCPAPLRRVCSGVHLNS